MNLYNSTKERLDLFDQVLVADSRFPGGYGIEYFLTEHRMPVDSYSSLKS